MSKFYRLFVILQLPCVYISIYSAFFLKKPDFFLLFSLFNSQTSIEYLRYSGGGKESRTPDPLLARQMLYQLSYTPIQMNRISSIRILKITRTFKIKQNTKFRLLRKEVIQPHLPIRLPCYDFTPIINPTFGSCLLKS